MVLISVRKKLTKISWYKYFGAKFSKRIRQGAQIDGLLPRVTPPDPRPEGRESRLFFDFLGRELTFFRNSLQGEGREWEKETPGGKGLGSWDT